jgi:predicted ATPase/class 3 adenylate cyclase
LLADRTEPTPSLPTGTVTFLFSDIEGSTRLLQEAGRDYSALLDRHRALIEAAVGRRDGRTFGSEGDALFVAFADAASAIAAATDAQRALQTEPWPDGRAVRVRMGIHTGEAILNGNDYVGLALHQVARITAAAHGEEVLVSAATRELAGSRLPAGAALRDLGEHRLRDLARPERLYRLVVEGLRDTFPPPRTLSLRPNNLPVQLTTFVGRREIEESQRLLSQTRLLTLSGPGGTGKTRLALQLGAEVMDDFPDGVYFVALDSVDDPELVPSAIAQALAVETGSAPPLDRLADHLRERRVLLILDNFEQVVDAAQGVSRLLREAPGLKAVVTSRVILRSYGEQEFAVPPLGLPPHQRDADPDEIARSEAVRLFVERAMAAVPAFRLDAQTAPVVADIVNRLDGLPLAIELAAARLRLLPVESLRARLDHRLATLTGGARDLPARQQTLRGAIDWSFNLLDEPDRQLFTRLAVFAGGASLPEAEHVAAPVAEAGRDVLEGLLSLTEKSLIRSVPSADPDPRFAMLATIREYGLELLQASGEVDEISRRHADAYLALVERCALSWNSAHSGPWLDRLSADHDNVRAALDWAIDHGEAEIAYRLAAGVWRFWQQRGHLDEAHARFPRILATAGSDALPPDLAARALGAAGSIEYWRGNDADTHRFYTLALEAARESGDPRLIAESVYNMGFGFRTTYGSSDERYTAGRGAWEEALTRFTELGDQRGVAGATWALAIADLTVGQHDEARRHLEQSIDLYRALGDVFGLGWAYHMLGILHLTELDQRAADGQFRRALEIFVQAGDLSGITLALVDFAGVAQLDGDEERYWRLNGAASELRRTSGSGISDVQFSAGVQWVLEEAPQDPDKLSWFRAGSALTTEEAIVEALAGSVVEGERPDQTVSRGP